MPAALLQPAHRGFSIQDLELRGQGSKLLHLVPQERHAGIAAQPAHRGFRIQDAGSRIESLGFKVFGLVPQADIPAWPAPAPPRGLKV